MLARLAIGAVLLAGVLASGATSPRVYVLSWASQGAVLPEEQALVEQADRELRDELKRRGAAVVEAPRASRGAIVLRPRLQVLPGALKLDVVGVRAWDRSLLGTISTRASGSSRQAQLRAIVRRACHEADQLAPR